MRSFWISPKQISTRPAWLLGSLSLLMLAAAGGPAARAQSAAEPEAPAVGAVRLAAANAALTGVLAVGRRWTEGRLGSWDDALETFLCGAGGGYGFYQAKRLAGRGHAAGGLALAYASASVVENVSTGRHPLGYVRLGTAPVDVRLRTPLARTEQGPPVTVEVNAVGAASLLVLPALGHRPAFRGGWLFLRSGAAVGEQRAGGTRAAGYAFGRAAVLLEGSGPAVRAHETIHVVQALQIGATTPYFRLGRVWPRAGRLLEAPFGAPVALDLQLDWLYGAATLAWWPVDYRRRWPEVEAYSLTAPAHAQ